MTPPLDLASRLLKFEQQLQAYQKLHGDELAELWQTLNECKREIAIALSHLEAEEDAGTLTRGPVGAQADGGEQGKWGGTSRNSPEPDQPEEEA